jgi:hypothetical protein
VLSAYLLCIKIVDTKIISCLFCAPLLLFNASLAEALPADPLHIPRCIVCLCWQNIFLVPNCADPQIARDAAVEVPPPDPILDGGSSPEERQASFLELALCLAGGLPDAALDPLFAVSDTLLGLVKSRPDRFSVLHPGASTVLPDAELDPLFAVIDTAGFRFKLAFNDLCAGFLELVL